MQPEGQLQRLWRTSGAVKWTVAALLLVLLFNYFFTAGFFSIEIKEGRLYGSLVDIAERAVPVLLLTLGMSLVIATGGIDLSVGAVMAISGASAALLVNQQSGWNFGVILLISLMTGLVAGLWNGVLVAFLQLQPIVATLILMVAGRGIAQLLTDGQIITFDHAVFNFLGSGYLLGLPFAVLLVCLCYILTSLFLRQTAAGLFIEATGDNPVASWYAGLKIKQIKLMVYGFSGFCAALAGLIAASDIKAADSNNVGAWLELDAILAVVLGGAALTGGRFHLLGAFLGAVLIQTVTTTILTRAVPVQLTYVVKALVIIIVCLAQSEELRRIIRLPYQRKTQ